MTSHSERLLKTSISLATMIALITLGLLPLLTPLTHVLLDWSDSAGQLGVSPAQTYNWSDTTIHQLIWGPGSFDVTGPEGLPLYTPAEADHLRDVQLMLRLVLALGSFAALGILLAFARARDRSALWQAVSRGGRWLTAAALIVAVAGLVAFRPAFHLFHEVFFSGGNYVFDASADRLVQLYPTDFWMFFAGGFGLMVLALSIAAWLIGRRLSRSAVAVVPNWPLPTARVAKPRAVCLRFRP
jgi:integral membrane protein (TIGR01906 family)